jgi:hypothetical protein
MTGVVQQQQRAVTVAWSGDVVVAGGGAAGFVAAVAAARAGASVALVERNTFLGGVATAGMMAAFVGTPWAAGIGRELLDKLADRGAAPRWTDDPERTRTTPFDPETLKDIMLEMVQGAGVHLLLGTVVLEPVLEGKRAAGILVAGKSGTRALLAGVVIDCTGDADLAHAAGAPCTFGRESDHKARPFALLFRLGGLDIPRIMQYVAAHPEELQPQYRKGTLLEAGCGGRAEKVVSRISGFYALVEQARRDGLLHGDCHYFRLENLWVERGTAVCNSTRVYGVDGTDDGDLTRGVLEARGQMHRLIAFARAYVPGCERAFLVDAAPNVGVRETRRILGEYTLSDDDAYGDARFDDAIMTMDAQLVRRPVPANLDVHMPEPIEGSERDWLERYPEKVPREPHSYQIPYGVLVPREVDGLLVAGRTIAVSHMIDGTTRNMLVVMRLAQAAGCAAALACASGRLPRAVDQAELRAALLRQGVETP